MGVEKIEIVMVFIISLFLGSFYNVVSLRSLEGESIVFPPSHCTKCGYNLKVLDLVPVLSYVWLKGKCRSCGGHITSIYPKGELMTAIFYTMLYRKYGIGIEIIPHIILATVLILATITDLKEMMVPDRFVIVGVIMLILYRVIYTRDLLAYSIMSGLGSFIILLVIGLISKGGIGGADIKMYILIGGTVGIIGSLSSLVYASYLAIIINIPRLIKKEAGRKTEIPFIPMIASGVFFTYIYNYFDLFKI